MEEATLEITWFNSPDMALAVKKNILRFAVPVDNSFLVKVAQTKDNLTSVEPASFFWEAWLSSHIVNVKF